MTNEKRHRDVNINDLLQNLTQGHTQIRLFHGSFTALMLIHRHQSNKTTDKANL